MALPKESAAHKIVTRLSKHIPAFTDVFDEETFYIFFFILVLVCIVAVFVLSRKIPLKDGGHID